MQALVRDPGGLAVSPPSFLHPGVTVQGWLPSPRRAWWPLHPSYLALWPPLNAELVRSGGPAAVGGRTPPFKGAPLPWCFQEAAPLVDVLTKSSPWIFIQRESARNNRALTGLGRISFCHKINVCW